MFDSATNRFTPLDVYPNALVPRSTDAPSLVASIPLDRSVGIDNDSVISLRFSKPLNVETVNTSTVSLSGPKGLEKIAVVAAENGTLAFITPDSLLLPGVTYTVSVNGAKDYDGLLLPVSGITFSTKSFGGASDAQTKSGTGSGLTILPPAAPGTISTSAARTVVTSADPDFIWQGKLKDGKPHSDWQDLPALQAPTGVTALSGQILNLAGLPLAGVVLEAEDLSTGAHSTKVETDETGRFLLTDLSANRQELIIDGRRSRSRRNPQEAIVGPREDHGLFEYGIDTKDGTTTVLPFTIWLPKIDTANAVKIQSPTESEVVITSPHIPGLELRLAPGTTITDHDGETVREVSLTPIPLDRTPFPLANNIEVPLYFTAQPGGSYIYSTSKIGARVIYPNHTPQPPGARFNFWHYHPALPGWYIYGQARVTPDGKQVAPDPGVSVYEFTGAMFGGNNPGDPPGPTGCSAGPACKKGDPLDVTTGIFVMNKTDLSIPDIIPINITRSYRQGDPNSRAFGIGSNLPYNWFFYSTNFWFETDIVLGDGTRIRYNCVAGANCSSPYTAQLEHTATQTQFYKSTMKWNGSGWDITTKDGTVYVMGDNGPLQSIRSRNDSRLDIVRPSPNGNITRLVSTNGRWIEFTYDASNRIIQAKDNANRTVGYEYDASGRLWKVTDPMLGVTEYTYDSSHRMLTIKDPKGFIFLTNQYDANGRVIKQTMADGSIYQFAYTLDVNGKVTQTDVTDPRGNIERLIFYPDSQIQTDIHAYGTAVEQRMDYERDPVTNLLTSVTDALEITPGVRRKTAYTYDAKGNMLTATRMAQDVPGNQVTTTYTYEQVYNQVATITDPLGYTTTFSYDNVGHLATVQDALGNQTSYTYNIFGQPLMVTTPAGTSQFVYDFGDLTSVIDPLGNVTKRGIDTIGRLESMTNALGLTTNYSYDYLNRMTGVTDPLVRLTQFGYDPNSNLLSVSDAKAPSGVTGYSYDNMDRLQTRTDPLLKNESYVYDAACVQLVSCAAGVRSCNATKGLIQAPHGTTAAVGI